MVRTFSSPNNNTYTDCIVFQLSADGSYLVYSTAFGGLDFDYAYGIAIEDGEIYVTGSTLSSNVFPKVNAYDASHNGAKDCFVVKLIDDDDGDGLSTSQELFYGTDPHCSDSDNDNYLDAYEIECGTDPLDSYEYPGIHYGSIDYDLWNGSLEYMTYLGSSSSDNGRDPRRLH